MASTLSQIWLTIFLPKCSKCCTFLPIRLCSNFTSMWSKCLSTYLRRDFRLPMSASVMVTKKVRSETQFFFQKFAMKTFRCYRWKCWHWKTKVSQYIIWYVLGPHAGEIWTKSYCPKCTKFLAFWQKIEFFSNHLRQKRWRHFEDVPVAETSVQW